MRGLLARSLGARGPRHVPSAPREEGTSQNRWLSQGLQMQFPTAHHLRVPVSDSPTGLGNGLREGT